MDGRQRGVVQRLQAFPHVADDLENDLARGGGIGGGRTVHSWILLRFYQPGLPDPVAPGIMETWNSILGLYGEDVAASSRWMEAASG